jgi:hypothetical protein
VLQNREREEEEKRRSRCENRQRDVEAAMEFLAGAATGALRKMTFVITAHLRGDPRNIVAPTCQNCAYNPVGAFVSNRRHITITLQKKSVEIPSFHLVIG